MAHITESVNFTDEYADKPGQSFHSNPQDRAVLKMMTSVRAALSSGSNMAQSGKFNVCSSLYKSSIKVVMGGRKLTRIPQHLLDELENGLEKSKNCPNEQDAIWHLRRALEILYDEYVDMYCGVKDARFHPVHKSISNVISLAMALDGKKSQNHVRDLYSKSLKDIVLVDTISMESKKMLQDAIDTVQKEEDTQAQVFVLRKALDHVYDEVRLPDMVKKKLMESAMLKETKKKEEFLLDFSNSENTTIEFTPKILNDTIMGGKSTSELKLVDGEGLFEGSVSTASNGGFASIKFHPACVEKLREKIKNCCGFTIIAKNLETKVQRFKFQLASTTKMRAFNYQSEIMLPPSSDYVHVFLHISTFWPTMFGHILASQGKVDTDAVDAIGFIVSKLCDDGKMNPDFNEGHFSLAIKGIKIIY